MNDFPLLQREPFDTRAVRQTPATCQRRRLESENKKAAVSGGFQVVRVFQCATAPASAPRPVSARIICASNAARSFAALSLLSVTEAM